MLPRPEPGHLGWLANQSMLHQASGYIAEVSQSERIWLHSGESSRVDTLLLAAPSWLDALPAKNSYGSDFFALLERQLENLSASGIDGIYLGQIGESQAQLLGVMEQENSLASSLEPDPALGGSKAYDALLARAERASVRLGADLPEAATSRGPDFILQARHVTGYEGIYAMLSVPRDLWHFLPASRSEWDCPPLSGETVRELAAAGLVPAALRRDSLANYAPAGWASTGEVLGADGQPRRWIYRYDGNPENPVLLWQDPGGLARKIFSAAVIARTGLDGITLAGINMGALLGLEPDEDSGERVQVKYAPGLEAMKDLAAQIHRYGGWSLQADSVEEGLLRESLKAGCDFCRDDVAAALFVHAFLTGEAAPLGKLLQERLKAGIEEKRMARLTDAPHNRLRLLKGLVNGEQSESQLAKLASGADMPALDSALFCWNAGLPGLFFDKKAAIRQSEAKNGSVLPADYSAFLNSRRKYGLAAGKIHSIFQPAKTLLAVLVELPSHEFWLTAMNFGSGKENVELKLPASFSQATDVMTGEELAGWKSEGRQGSFLLEGHRTRSIIFMK